ncbi:addiction module antidote protein [Microvirga pudoricolor]|uniref:addiction module antidote protein n=1 Tax=Microvirga pudoricolor TaxID=2778729 RepID=UPI001950E397|nr:addiction module antidote protein [Microvirga pudoricolor]MBM6594659.1 putative addiction module antidote protein [Microvirga pudoricolor]
MKVSELQVFDPTDFIGTPEGQAEYIAAALETGDVAEIRSAINAVARARGMTDIAKSAELSRESLYKAFGSSGNPEFTTVLRVLSALGLQLTVKPSNTSAHHI